MDGAAKSGRRRVYVTALLAVVVVAVAVTALILWPARRSMDTPDGVEAIFERSPADRDTMRALKANFPTDYRQLLERVAAAHRDRGTEAAMREGSAFMTRFMNAKINAVTAAPDRSLQRISGASLGLMQVLRDENVRLCAQLSMTGLTADTRLSSSALAHLSRLDVYTIEAARAGEAPGRTPRQELSQTEYDAWFAAMRAIDPVATRRLETDDGTRLPPESQCRDGIVMYEGVMRLPGPMAANVSAHLLRESTAPPEPAR